MPCSRCVSSALFALAAFSSLLAQSDRPVFTSQPHRMQTARQLFRTRAATTGAGTLAATSIFLEASTYNSGGYEPSAIAVADVNGDGKLDLVVANYCASSGCTNGSVAVLLGNGDGTFQAAQTYSSGGADAVSIAVADVNGDGKPDIVVASACANSSCAGECVVGVLLGNGDGTFQAAQTYSSGGFRSVSVAVADVNGDGKPDIVVANYCASSSCTSDSLVGVLLGNGDGTFQTAQTYGSGGLGADSVAVADVNGDGKPDIVVANECVSAAGGCAPGDGVVGVLLGNGDGTFQPVQTYDSGGYVASSIAVADVNGDGKPDLVVANWCQVDTGCTSADYGVVAVLLGNGDGTFQAARTYNAGGDLATFITVGDVNGDGKPDVVVANGSADGVGVLLGNGDGTFQAAQNYSSGGQNPSSIAVADVNGDGKLDLVATGWCEVGTSCPNGNNGLVGVLFGNGDGTFQAAQSYSYGDKYDAYSTAVGDLNGDGKPDLVVASGCVVGISCNGNGTDGVVSVLLGNGDGTFQAAQTYDSGAYIASSVAVGDVNGDGKPDLVVANVCFSSGSCDTGVIETLLGNGDGTFRVSSITYPGTPIADYIAIADVNGDGKPDLVVADYCLGGSCSSGAVSVLLGNGNGTFQATQNYSSGGLGAYSVAVADVNGDGKPDIVVANAYANGSSTSNSVVGVLLGNGDGTFQSAQTYSSGGYEATSIAVADVNGDGKPDIVVANNCASSSDCSTGVVGVLLGNGDGTFQPALLTITPVVLDFGPSGISESPQIGQVALADFNGDGHLDVAIGGYGVVLLGNGDGTFQTPMNLGVGGVGTAVGDFNRDGSPDLALAGADGAVTILVNRNSSLQATTTELSSSPNPATYGQTVTFSATVTANGSAVANGTMTFTDGTKTLGTASVTNGAATLSTSALSVGVHDIIASYNENSKFAGSNSSPLTETVDTDPTTTTLASSANPSSQNSSVTFTATVTGSGPVPPTGTVTFNDGSTQLGTGTLNGSGVTTFTTSSLAPGLHSITAAYGGDANNAASTSSVLTQTIYPLLTTTTLASSANPSSLGSSVTFTATVTPSGSATPTGTITFLDGSTQLGTGTLNSSGVTTYTTSSLATGQHSITAAYGGDAKNAASTSTVLTQTVNADSTTTTLASSANPSYQGSPVSFTATVTTSGSTMPTGTVTFLDGSTQLGTATLNGSGVATFTSPYALTTGQHSITAAYGGDGNNAPSTSAVLTQTVNPAAIVLSPVSGSVTVPAGTPAQFTITVTPEGTFTSPINFSCSGLPAYANCAFNPSTVTLQSSAVTTNVTISTTARSVSSLMPPFEHHVRSLPAMWLVLPSMMLGIAGLGAHKRRKLYACAFLGLLAVGCFFQAACGSSGSSGGAAVAAEALRPAPTP